MFERALTVVLIIQVTILSVLLTKAEKRLGYYEGMHAQIHFGVDNDSDGK